MASDIKLNSEELLAEYNQVPSSEDELDRLKELYHFADFGRLSAGLFHDLATPLNIVLLNLEELKEKFQEIDDEALGDFQDAVNRAFSGTERMMKFLQLAREHMQEREVLSMFSIQQEIEEVIKTIQHSTHKKIEISLQVNRDEQIFGNATQLFQIILNLVSNAVDAYEESIPKKIEITLTTHEHEICIEVRDWGKGIPPQEQSNIFQPFFTTKPTGKGTGIGLFISRDNLEKHFRGTLTFDSQFKKGTTFTIHLPRRGEPLAST